MKPEDQTAATAVFSLSDTADTVNPRPNPRVHLRRLIGVWSATWRCTDSRRSGGRAGTKKLPNTAAASLGQEGTGELAACALGPRL